MHDTLQTALKDGVYKRRINGAPNEHNLRQTREFSVLHRFHQETRLSCHETIQSERVKVCEASKNCSRKFLV
jgi:hypothetical protein